MIVELLLWKQDKYRRIQSRLRKEEIAKCQWQQCFPIKAHCTIPFPNMDRLSILSSTLSHILSHILSNILSNILSRILHMLSHILAYTGIYWHIRHWYRTCKKTLIKLGLQPYQLPYASSLVPSLQANPLSILDYSLTTLSISSQAPR